jgi:pimeloyl-ACP methyl ester carboxylesterase
MNEVSTHTVHTNGVDLNVFEAGDPSNPTVLLCHGFPEAAYSWRHQIPVLAEAGYHVVAPDQRGYGQSSLPKDVADYGILDLVGDLTGLLDHYGKDDAIFVGHDWGALIVWEATRLAKERVRAVVGVSVPAVAWPGPPTQLFKMVYQDNFFYMLYFQPVGPAEAELDADPYESIRKIFWGASGQGFAMPTGMVPMEGNGFLTHMPEPPPLPWVLDGREWFTQADLDFVAEQYRRSGFFGPVSYYRNLDANYEIVKDLGLDQVTMPSFFIGGTNDPVLVMDDSGLERMKNMLPDYRGAVMLEGAGHWTQQEKPAEFNDALLGFLDSL